MCNLIVAQTVETFEGTASLTDMYAVLFGQQWGKEGVGGWERRNFREKWKRASATDTSRRCLKLAEMNQGQMDYVTVTTLKIGYAVY